MSDERPIATYEHRAKPYAVAAEFSLFERHVHVEQGRRSGDFAFSEIVMIRLAYKPKNTTTEGYAAKIYRRDKRTASLNNLSWKSLVDLDRQDEDYRRFIEKFVAQATKVNPSIILEAGLPRWLHSVSMIVGALTVAGLVAVTAHSLWSKSWPIAALTAALCGYFGWWTWRYLGRNLPRPFTPGTIPQDVLPKAPAVGSRQSAVE